MIEISAEIAINETKINIASEGVLKDIILSPAGIELIESLLIYLKEKREFLTSNIVCHRTIITLGYYSEEVQLQLRGRNTKDGSPIPILVTSKEIQGVIADTINQIVDVISNTIQPVIAEAKSANLAYSIKLKGEFNNIITLCRGLEELLDTSIIVTS